MGFPWLKNGVILTTYTPKKMNMEPMKFGHLQGVPQPYLGDLLTMVINHVSKSWDDPPSWHWPTPGSEAAHRAAQTPPKRPKVPRVEITVGSMGFGSTF